MNLCAIRQYIKKIVPELKDNSDPYGYYKEVGIGDRKGIVAPLDFKSIQLIVSDCIVLTELNLRDSCLSDESIMCLVNNLTETIEKLDLNGNLNVKDRHVITLVNRCKKITDLNLMVTSISNNSVTTIICTQSQILVKLGVSNVDFKKLLELRSMLRLKVLNFDNIVTLDELTILKNQLPHLNINEDGPKAMKLRIPYPVGDLRLLKTLKRLHIIKYAFDV